MRSDEYAPDVNEPHDLPDFVRVVGPEAELLRIEIAMTKYDWLLQLARWYRCSVGAIPEDVLDRYGLTRDDRDEAAMDAALVKLEATRAAELAEHYLSGTAEERPLREQS